MLEVLIIMVKKGDYRKRSETKIVCVRRNQGRPFLSRGCTLPTVKMKSRAKTKTKTRKKIKTKITKKTRKRK
jgi:hypothetical protein